LTRLPTDGAVDLTTIGLETVIGKVLGVEFNTVLELLFNSEMVGPFWCQCFKTFFFVTDSGAE
jgi:hypothetical protein